MTKEELEARVGELEQEVASLNQRLVEAGDNRAELEKVINDQRERIRYLQDKVAR